MPHRPAVSADLTRACAFAISKCPFSSLLHGFPMRRSQRSLNRTARKAHLTPPKYKKTTPTLHGGFWDRRGPLNNNLSTSLVHLYSFSKGSFREIFHLDFNRIILPYIETYISIVENTRLCWRRIVSNVKFLAQICECQIQMNHDMMSRNGKSRKMVV